MKKIISTFMIVSILSTSTFSMNVNAMEKNKEIDTINSNYNSRILTVSVKSVGLNSKSITLKKGTNYTLKATVSPSNATNKAVTWKSSNTKVATVDANGNVKAIGAGSATITVTTKDGKKTSTCKVTVSIPQGITKLEVTQKRNTLTMTIYLNKSATNKAINALDELSGITGALAGITAVVPAGQAASPYIGAASGILYLNKSAISKVSEGGKYPVKLVTKAFVLPSPGVVPMVIPISYIAKQ